MTLSSSSPTPLETGSPGSFPEPGRSPALSPQRRACLRGATGRKPSGAASDPSGSRSPRAARAPRRRRASGPGLPLRGRRSFWGCGGCRCACAGAAWFLVTVEGVEAAPGSPGTQAHRGGRQDRARRPWRRPGRPAPAGGPGPRHRNGPDPAQGGGQVQRDPRPARAGRAPGLDGAVVTADAMRTQAATAAWTDFPAAAQDLQVGRTRTTTRRTRAGATRKKRTSGVVHLTRSPPAGQAHPRAVADLGPGAPGNREPPPPDPRRHPRRGPPPAAHRRRPTSHGHPEERRHQPHSPDPRPRQPIATTRSPARHPGQAIRLLTQPPT